MKVAILVQVLLGLVFWFGNGMNYVWNLKRARLVERERQYNAKERAQNAAILQTMRQFAEQLHAAEQANYRTSKANEAWASELADIDQHLRGGG